MEEKKGTVVFLGLFMLLLVLCSAYVVFASSHSSLSLYTYDRDASLGWVSYAGTVYNETNRLTVGTTPINFTMQNYTLIRTELPSYVADDEWFNGTHVLTDKEGNAYLIRMIFSSELQAGKSHCEFNFDLGGSVGTVPIKTVYFPDNVGVEVQGVVSNVYYTLGTWKENGAVIQIECSKDVEFWDFSFVIQKTYVGRGTY